MENEIVFLLKFIPEESYVDKLIDYGELFMRPLDHFAKYNGDKARDDIREGLLLDCVRACANRPIYCMYSVFDNKVLAEGILINKLAIQGFFPEGPGYFAVINYKDFISKLKSDFFDGYAAIADIVNYGSIEQKVQEQLLVTDPHRAAFVKNACFSYQQEFRLIVLKNLPIIKDEKAIEEYKKKYGYNFTHDFQTYSNYVVQIGNLQHCAKKFSTEDLLEYDDECYILKII